MKVAVVGYVSRSGGALTVLTEALRFAEQGAQDIQWLFVLSDQKLTSAAPNVRIERVPRRGGSAVSRLRFELLLLPNILRSEAPDVVLSLQNSDHLGRGEAKLAVYAHQPLPFQGTRRFSLRSPSERGLAFRQRFLGVVMRTSIRRADVVFAQTQWMTDRLKEEFPTKRVVRVGSPSRVRRPSAVESRSPEGFVYPAAPVLYKDHAVLHDALKVLRREGVAMPPVALTMAREQLERLVGPLSDESASFYEFVGTVPREELDDLYARRMLVFPSYIETLGLPLYEAQIFGHAIIAADTPFAREALDGYTQSLFFRASDARALALALEEAWRATPSDMRPPTAAEASRGSEHWETVAEEIRGVARAGGRWSAA